MCVRSFVALCCVGVLRKRQGFIRELITTTRSRSQSGFLGPAFRVQNAPKSAEKLSSSVSELQTEGTLTLTAFADNAIDVRSTDSAPANLSDERDVRAGKYRG